MKSKLNVCVIDNQGGNYLTVARKLVSEFNEVFYWSSNQSPFPHPALSYIGTGFNGINVLQDFWSNLDAFDLIVIPDIGFEGWKKHLQSIGKLVWGGNDILESDRNLFKEVLERLQMPVNRYVYIKGAKQARKYLNRTENVYVKISKWRGLNETFKWINKSQSSNIIEHIIISCGDLESEIEFIIEQELEAICEFGFDGYNVNGQFPQPKKQMMGIETKDVGYVGKVGAEFKPVIQSNNEFSKALSLYGYKGFYSTEVRYTSKGLAYYTDPCCRAGSPPSSAYLSNLQNLGEIIINGAKGLFIEPIWKSKYIVELIIKSSYTNDDYLKISYSEQYEDNICLKGAFKVNGQVSIIPFGKVAGYNCEEFGSVCTHSDSLETAMSQAIEIVGSIEAYDLFFQQNALEKTMETINKVEETLQIKF